jgi:hypothetical protein
VGKARLFHPAGEGLRDCLVGLVLEQLGEQEVALFEQFEVFFLAPVARKKPCGLEFEKRRRDDDEAGPSKKKKK